MVVEGFSVSFACSVYVNRPVDGDSPEPKEDAPIVVIERLDAFKSDSKRVFQNILSQFGNG